MATSKVVVEGSSRVTAAQLKDLFRQIEDGSIDGKGLQAFLEHRTPFPVLTIRGRADIVVKEQRSPRSFFKDRPGLWVSGGFRDNVAARAEAVDVGTTFGVDCHEITAENGATDEQIETALGDRHLFNETQVSAIIAEMITAQEADKAGALLNNGSANLFYTSGLVVDVGWRAVDRKWGVYAWERDDRWLRGCRVFAPSN